MEQAPGEFRVIHDGTHGVSVNNFIKVRDQEACPLAGDLLSALDAEFDESDEQLFGLVFDASKAHRRVPVAPADWGLQACSLRPDRSPPGAEDIIWLNTVGTYGVGSAAYWWSRPSSLMLRLMHYVHSPVGLRWAFRYADEFATFVRARSVWRPLAMMVLLLRSVRFPLKWKKFRGGFV